VVTFAVEGIKQNHPSGRLILEMIVLVRAGKAHALPNSKCPARLPGERFAVRRCRKLLDADDLVPRLGFQYDTHYRGPSGKVVFAVVYFAIGAYVRVPTARVLNVPVEGSWITPRGRRVGTHSFPSRSK
jgi:hypothetical protein